MYKRQAHDSPLVIGLAIASLVTAALVALRLLSVALAILQFHGFTLREDDGRISVERGLLARSRSSAKRRRIQAWSLRETVLHRWFRRRSPVSYTHLDVYKRQTMSSGRWSLTSA